MNPHVISSTTGGVGILTLNRPEALNALSLDMIRAITQALRNWRDDDSIDLVLLRSSSERAFCAGGDIRFFHRVASGGPRDGSALLEDFFTEEYWLNHLIHTYPKPTVALMDGIVMGGGMGISQGASMRIVTERTRMGMPEVSIGLFPDVGGGYFLSRAARRTGHDLALTGRVIDAADALYAGLADRAVRSTALAGIVDVLARAKPGKRLDALAQHLDQPDAKIECATGVFGNNIDALEHHFSHDDLPSILASLRADDGDYARTAIELMAQRSPLMMCVTLEQLRRAQDMSVAQCLRMERTMIRRSFEGTEVLEGIRSRVIDKDHAPRWQHDSAAGVQPEAIARYFVPAWPDYAHPLRELD
ncbi:enoyl-CoA hydratase/isomerase family protein [Lacisediminimonas profundi]|uniref:enoyl-CoA hydratase/isomerase family protein n=1 Tax=Lacisediminimonas profundi TaxID=2603856 RepID=UPI00124B8F08|nr:enoyl-CoA hydratase/isomerase family protein [Lacisediminimonas profundi]